MTTFREHKRDLEILKYIWKAKPRERLEDKIKKISPPHTHKKEEKDKGFENGREKIK